jgi:hypothetical protein
MSIIPDQPGHELGLAVIAGEHEAADTPWDGATMTYWSLSDTVTGSGKQQGYFYNRHLDGDRTFGAFEATLKTNDVEGLVEGKWQLSGGTGRYAKITGGGPFSARISSTDIVMSWSGEYALGD